MGLAEERQKVLAMVDVAAGTVDRRIFADQSIYELELEHIFARAWNFVAHDSQIPNPGDFFMTYIGEDRVIVVRDTEMQPQVLVNSCRHRGNAVCRAEEGHATSFMCTYHGWTYDLKGALVGVPGFKEVYHEELDRAAWGLIKAAHVDSYHGLIFATMDADAPKLEEYLGDVGRICVDMLAAKGNLYVSAGVQKYTIRSNWKFAVDNAWDWYHVPITHASTFMSGFQGQDTHLARTPSNVSLTHPHMVLLGEYGHAVAGATVPPEKQTKKPPQAHQSLETPRAGPKEKDVLGIARKSRGSSHIFPNLFVSHYRASLVMPRGPGETEIWRFAFLDRNVSQKKNREILSRVRTVFGPAGMQEQDDTDNWEQSTRAAAGAVTQRYPLNYAMGLGHDKVDEDESGPPRIETQVNEHAQRWLYTSWSEWLAAESWQDLRANHSHVPTGLI